MSAAGKCQSNIHKNFRIQGLQHNIAREPHYLQACLYSIVNCDAISSPGVICQLIWSLLTPGMFLLSCAHFRSFQKDGFSKSWLVCSYVAPYTASYYARATIAVRLNQTVQHSQTTDINKHWTPMTPNRHRITGCSSLDHCRCWPMRTGPRPAVLEMPRPSRLAITIQLLVKA